MSIKAKRVLVIEDEGSVREPLVYALRNRGFNAEGAANVPEGRRLINELRQDIDVAVLDMSLEDPQFPSLTGADLGEEAQRAHPELPPEFLVFSGHSNADYYDAALQLGAAAYVLKGTLQQEDLIRHIRSLALRRALNIKSKEIREKIDQIAEKHTFITDTVVKLCSQVIEPEMKACLGVSTIFLLTDSKGTRNCFSNADLPLDYSPVYDIIQTRTFEDIDNTGFYIFENQHVNHLLNPQAQQMFQQLNGSGFLPLHTAPDFQLSVGMLQTVDITNSLPEKPDKLAAMLSSRLRSTFSNLFSVLLQLITLNMKRDVEKKALLEHTWRFCLHVGQTQLDVLNEAVENKEIEPNQKWFQKLKKLALDLQATGNELSQLSGIRKVSQAVSVSSVVNQAWNEIQEQYLAERIRLIEKGEDFNLVIEQRDLSVAVLRVLQWMAQREDKIPAEVLTPTIEVEYAQRKGHLEIRFTDYSRRLGSQLRQKLFDPFAQATTPVMPVKEEGEEPPGLYLPLYLAKTLIEVKNDGSLEDRSDEREDHHGHLFVISFAIEEDNTQRILIS